MNLKNDKFYYISLALTAVFIPHLAAQTTAIPQRIISLVPSVTEEIYQLGAQDKLVGVTNFCIYPEDARKKEKVGTFLQPNIEKILRLKPDIVFATKEGHSKNLVEKMQRLGLNIHTFEPCRGYKDILSQFIELGEIIGEKEKARKIATSVLKKINSIRERTRQSKELKIFWQIGANPLITSGRDTFADELIHMSGGINIAHNSKIRYPRYSREEVIREDPNIIIIVEMGIETGREINQWYKFRELKAVKRRRIYVLDGHGVLSPTPLSYLSALEKIVKLIR
ncbi:MAG: cobalamin-binding protein [Elusimicrobiota bacterium]